MKQRRASIAKQKTGWPVTDVENIVASVSFTYKLEF